ncbi:MAG: radical SAM family heme chaperone HemW [bacterium]|nr:radical SAM family heme chaperone HemW [bacterium]
MNTSSDRSRPGLYVHVPFCRSVCPYCDFAVTIAGEQRREGYLESILREALHHRHGEWAEFDTVYFGGGTPSQLEPDQLGRIVDDLREALPISSDAQCYLEANPEDVTPKRARTWRNLGITILSLGIQSFDDEILKFLGRGHTSRQAVEAVTTLREVGFPTVAADLIYGMDGLDPEGWRRQLEMASDIGIDHLSCYELTVHSRTVFGRRLQRGDLFELEGESKADQFFLTHRLLAELGLPGYEVSNFARSERHQSQHNLKYWRHEPYLGLGPSAHSFDGSRRWWNFSKLRLWASAIAMGGSAVEETENLNPLELATEAVMLGLRTYEGVDLERVEKTFGVELRAANKLALQRFMERGQIKVSGTCVRPTLEGLAVADSLAQGIVPELGVSTIRGSDPYHEEEGGNR